MAKQGPLRATDAVGGAEGLGGQEDGPGIVIGEDPLGLEGGLGGMTRWRAG